MEQALGQFPLTSISLSMIGKCFYKGPQSEKLVSLLGKCCVLEPKSRLFASTMLKSLVETMICLITETKYFLGFQRITANLSQL